MDFGGYTATSIRIIPQVPGYDKRLRKPDTLRVPDHVRLFTEDRCGLDCPCSLKTMKRSTFSLSDKTMKHNRFSFKAAIELASPPTWVASIGPCLIAGALAVCGAMRFSFAPDGMDQLTQMAVVLDVRSAVCWILMLFCGILMQSAVNTLNDYQDFKSGLDTSETVLDETDASIVYNRINPRSALMFAVVLLAVAAMLGMVVVVLSSWLLLVAGLIAAVVIVLYSAGPKPISSLPLGELVSGLVMGGILTCTTFFAATLSFSSIVLALSVVPVISIAQIMLTNNTCDIERDLAVGRRTLPGIIGLKHARTLNAALCLFTFIWLAIVLFLADIPFGIIIVAAVLIFCVPSVNRLLKGSYRLTDRRAMMGTVVSYNKWLCFSAVTALLLGGIVSAII